MNSYHACRVCDQPSIQLFNILEQKVIKDVIVGKNRYYCSQKCRDEDNKGGLTGLLLIFAAGAFIFSEVGFLDEFFGFILFIGLIALAVVLAILGARRRANLIHAPYTKAISSLTDQKLENQAEEEFVDEYLSDEEFEDLRNLELDVGDDQVKQINDDTNGPIPLRMNPENMNQIYSDILQKYVDICCHQSARLGDKYCMCGKGLVYPILDN